MELGRGDGDAARERADGCSLAGGGLAGGLTPTRFGTRYYDPAVGRWTQVDPTGVDPHYVYAKNSPVNFVDPSGGETVGDALCHDVAFGGGLILGEKVTRTQYLQLVKICGAAAAKMASLNSTDSSAALYVWTAVGCVSYGSLGFTFGGPTGAVLGCLAGGGTNYSSPWYS